MRTIKTQQQLKDLAVELGVREDWHEPDEQDVTVKVEGRSFDNAGFWPTDDVDDKTILEKHVVIKQGGKPVAAINLASLFAMACGNPMED